MPSCTVKGCKNYDTKVKKRHGISYHRFPNDPVRKENWNRIIRIQRKEPYFKPHKNTRVCSAHFCDRDVDISKAGLRRLKESAIPRLEIEVPKTSQIQSRPHETDYSVSAGGESPASGDGTGDGEPPVSGGEGGSGRGGEGACAACGGDVGKLGRRARGSPAEQFIEAAIFPRELNEKTLLCNDCYNRYCNKGKQTIQKNPRKSTQSKGASRRVALSEESANVNFSYPSTSDVSVAPQQTITLPDYKRAPSCSEHCLFPYCPTTNLHIIPQYMKRCLLRDYKLYTPEHSQVCTEHLVSKNWETILNISKSDFTAQQIQDVISISMANISAFNFHNIEDIPPHLLLYLTGVNHRQLKKILDSLPSLIKKTKTPVLALTAYLTKLRTNDSLDRLSTLFRTKTSILEKFTTAARECMLKDFVLDHSKIPTSTAKSKKASGVVTEDNRMLSHLQEHYYRNESITKVAAALHPHLENLASSKLSQCRKRKNSSDSDEESLASKVQAKKCVLKEKVETHEPNNPQTYIELAIEYDSGERGESGVVSESSEDEGELSEQPRMKEEPNDESEAVDEGETREPDDQHLVYAPKPTGDLQADPLDTVAVPAPLLEHVKSEEDPVTVKEDPGEEEAKTHATAGTSQPSTDSSFTVYYTKGVSNFIQGPAPEP